MSFTIRFATKNDMKAVHDLITELAVYENEPDAVEVSIEDLERDGFSDVPKFRVFLAEEGNNVIGMALFYELSLIHI